MRVFHIQPDGFQELTALPDALPERGFLWMGYGRREFEVGEASVQQALMRWGCGNIVDLHVSDLINNQLPS
ncbi:MAG: magnesium transporter CorA, partial [Roseateles sp.]